MSPRDNHPKPQEKPQGSAGHVVDGLSLVGLSVTLPTGESAKVLQQLADGQLLLLLPSNRLERMPLEGLILAAAPSLPDPAMLTTDQAARLLNISTRTLRRRLEAAPANLEGAPIDLNAGGKRRHLRWASADVHRWAKAYERWCRAPKSRPKKRSRRPARSHRPTRGGSLYAQAFKAG